MKGAFAVTIQAFGRMRGRRFTLTATGCRRILGVIAMLVAGVRASTAQPDLKIIGQLRDEGQYRSHVAETLVYLTEVIGPRLSGSPAMLRASKWTRDKLAELGLENAHIEPWGTFLPGWTLDRFSAQVLHPRCVPLIAFPKAWSPGLPATLEAEAVYFDATDKASVERYRGTLRCKIVLNGAVRKIGVQFEPDAKRHTDEDVLDVP